MSWVLKLKSYIQINIHYYYSKGQFICARYQDNLYVTLNIPLTNIPDAFLVYLVNMFPISLHENVYSHITQIENLPEAIAISVSKGLYFPLTILETHHLDSNSQYLRRR